MISDSGGGSKIRLIGRRMFILTAAKAVVVFGVVGRLISLQINESKKYKTLSDKNRFREWKFAPPRGVIKDYFDEEIAEILYIPSLIRLRKILIGLRLELSRTKINKESKIKTNKENFCFAPLCKRAERITIPKSSRLVDMF